MLGKIMSNATVMRQTIFNPSRLRRELNTKTERFKRFMENITYEPDNMPISKKDMKRMNRVAHDGKRQWERDLEMWDSSDGA